jgi:uncharacterized membrane protein
MKQILLALVALLFLAIVPSALAMTVNVKNIAAGPVSVQIGEIIPITVTHAASLNMSDVVITAELAYNGRKVDVESKTIDMISGTTYTETLNLKIPTNIKTTVPGESYKLSVRMQDNNGNEIASTQYQLTVQRVNAEVEIQKVMTSYAKAGEPLIVTVVVKNTGSDAIDDVYAKVSIPELGSNVVAEERMGDVASVDTDEDKDTATKDIALRIPVDAADGTYTLKVEVYNDNDDVTASTTKSIYLDGITPAEKFVEVVPTAVSQDVSQGKTATYNLRIANIGDATKTFSISVEGAEGWATSKVNPLDVTLSPESSQVVTVAITAANNALAGEHKFAVKVSSNDAAKTISLTANVNENSGKVDTLLISVIVLAIVLVVLIAILVKTRKSGDELAEAEESYY